MPPLDNVANSTGDGGGISDGVIVGVIVGGLFLVAVVAASIYVARNKSELKTRPAAANYNRAPRTSDTPMPYGGVARPTAATAASYINAAFTMAGAGAVYEEIPDSVP